MISRSFLPWRARSLEIDVASKPCPIVYLAQLGGGFAAANYTRYVQTPHRARTIVCMLPFTQCGVLAPTSGHKYSSPSHPYLRILIPPPPYFNYTPRRRNLPTMYKNQLFSLEYAPCPRPRIRCMFHLAADQGSNLPYSPSSRSQHGESYTPGLSLDHQGDLSRRMEACKKVIKAADAALRMSQL